jgi:hypothetical protein
MGVLLAAGGLEGGFGGCLRAGRLVAPCRVVTPPHTLHLYLMQFRFPFFLEGTIVTEQFSSTTSISEQWRHSPSACTTSSSVSEFLLTFLLIS